MPFDLGWRLRRLFKPGILDLGDDRHHLSEAQADALRASRIRSISNMWGKVGEHYYTGVKDFAQTLAQAPQPLLPESDLVELLATTAKREAGEYGSGWVRRHLPDLVALLVVFGVGYLLVLSAFRGRPPWLPMRQQVVASAGKPLPAGHLIDKDDVTTHLTPVQPTAFEYPADIIGRITLNQITPGSVVVSDDLAEVCWPSGISTLPGNVVDVLTVPVKSATIETVQRNTCASILIAPHQPNVEEPTAGVLQSVLVLNLNRSGDASTLTFAAALSEKDRTGLAHILGLSDIFVAQPAPRPAPAVIVQ